MGIDKAFDDGLFIGVGKKKDEDGYDDFKFITNTEDVFYFTLESMIESEDLTTKQRYNIKEMLDDDLLLDDGIIETIFRDFKDVFVESFDKYNKKYVTPTGCAVLSKVLIFSWWSFEDDYGVNYEREFDIGEVYSKISVDVLKERNLMEAKEWEDYINSQQQIENW